MALTDFSGAFAPPNKLKPKSLFEFAAPSFDEDSSDIENTHTTGESPTNAAYLPPGSRPTSNPTFSSAYAAPSGSVTAPNLGQRTRPDIVSDIYAPRLRDVTEKLDEAYQAPRPGGIRGTIGALLGARAPVLGDLISGDYQRKQNINALQKEGGLLSGAITGNRAQTLQDAQIANYQSEADLRKHQGTYYDAETQAKLNPPTVPKEEEWSVVPNVEGPNGEPVQVEKHSGQTRVAPLSGASHVTKTTAPNETEQALNDYLDANKLPHTPENKNKARMVIATRNRVPKDPEVAELSKDLKKAQLEKLKEPSPDEQRRADLAKNLDENLSQIEDIARRRPELFGPLSGRVTGAKQWLGSSDPDVAAMKNIEEQTGLAMVGTHAMRNAQHAEKAAQSITNAYKNTADVLLSPQGPISSARKSLETFKGDAERRRTDIDNAINGTPRNSSPASAGGAKIIKYDAQGNRVQ